MPLVEDTLDTFFGIVGVVDGVEVECTESVVNNGLSILPAKLGDVMEVYASMHQVATAMSWVGNFCSSAQACFEA